MLRVTGDLVKGLQTAFAENWLEASGEILAEEDFLLTDVGEPRVVPPGSGLGMVINSSPSAGRSPQARILFPVLVGGAEADRDLLAAFFPGPRPFRRAAPRRGTRRIGYPAQSPK